MPRDLTVRAWVRGDRDRPGHVSGAFASLPFWRRMFDGADALLVPVVPKLANTASRDMRCRQRLADGLVRAWLPIWLDGATQGEGLTPSTLAEMLRGEPEIQADLELPMPAWGDVTDPANVGAWIREIGGARAIDATLACERSTLSRSLLNLTAAASVRQRDPETTARRAALTFAECVYSAAEVNP